jgi:mycothiol synthase
VSHTRGVSATPTPENPSADEAYRWDTLGPDTLAAWADLVNHLALVDGTEEFLSAADLAEELATPGHDPARDTVAVWQGGDLVAFGAVYCPATPDHEGRSRAWLQGGVHAEHRGRGLGREVMDRLEPRATELLAERHPGRTGYLGAGGGLEGSTARRLLHRRGYAVVRYFNLLTRGLGDEPEVPQVPGALLLTPGPEHEEAVRQAHNAAFRDHWGSGDIDEERWHERWTSRSVRAEVSTIAVDDDGQVLAYVLCGQWVARELYVTLVGTIREGRGRGLAAACLARTIGAATRSGDYDVIELDVDSDSPTGATRLYERVGFTRKHQTADLHLDLPR